MTLDKWLKENYPDARVIPYSLVVYKCPACGSRYTVCPEEASVPYCTNEDCPDREEETCPECVIAELKEDTDET